MCSLLMQARKEIFTGAQLHWMRNCLTFGKCVWSSAEEEYRLRHSAIGMSDLLRLSRDHRKLGQELDLFSLNEAAGAGLVFWHPRGAMVRSLIEDFWKNAHLQRGYNLLYTCAGPRPPLLFQNTCWYHCILKRGWARGTEIIRTIAVVCPA